MGQLSAEKMSTQVNSANTLIFLHGMLGQGRTWRQFVLNDQISYNRDILLVDLRNHGESDHHASMTYSEMANDLIRFLDNRKLDKVILVGHNIGGKTAMHTASLFPERIKGLISLDTAPIGTTNDKKLQTLKTLETITSLDVEGKTRKSAIEIIGKKFTDKGIANMISNNLAYSNENEHKTVNWCVNLDSIVSNIDQIVGFP